MSGWYQLCVLRTVEARHGRRKASLHTRTQVIPRADGQISGVGGRQTSDTAAHRLDINWRAWLPEYLCWWLKRWSCVWLVLRSFKHLLASCVQWRPGSKGWWYPPSNRLGKSHWDEELHSPCFACRQWTLLYSVAFQRFTTHYSGLNVFSVIELKGKCKHLMFHDFQNM